MRKNGPDKDPLTMQQAQAEVLHVTKALHRNAATLSLVFRYYCAQTHGMHEHAPFMLDVNCFRKMIKVGGRRWSGAERRRARTSSCSLMCRRASNPQRVVHALVTAWHGSGRHLRACDSALRAGARRTAGSSAASPSSASTNSSWTCSWPQASATLPKSSRRTTRSTCCSAGGSWR